MGQMQSGDRKDQQQNGPTRDATDLEINSNEGKYRDPKCPTTNVRALEQQHVRKLSNVSLRNIQLLSMKPRSEKEAWADDLRTRRRSSLINLILGAPSSGPRFSDDLCSLSSHISECTFGIEFFPDIGASHSSLRLEGAEDGLNRGQSISASRHQLEGSGSIQQLQQQQQQSTSNNNSDATANQQKRRRSSLGSLVAQIGLTTSDHPSGGGQADAVQDKDSAGSLAVPSSQPARKQPLTLLASTLASIDLTSSFEQHDKSGRILSSPSAERPPLRKTKQTIYESGSQESLKDLKTRLAQGRVNQSASRRVLRRSGSELSLYSTSSGSISSSHHAYQRKSRQSREGGCMESGMKQAPASAIRETKLIIMLQVCLPFILTGFGNMAAGLVLNRVAHWRAFREVPIFFILLPPFVGLKGNIEMTLASRLSTLSNLRLLDTPDQRRHAYLSNLVLVMSQAIGLSVFASLMSIVCECFIGNLKFEAAVWQLIRHSLPIVLASAMTSAMILALMSNAMMSLAVSLAKLIQVNPDNLSTLIAALYGDVSCVLIYGLVADWMYSQVEQNIMLWPFLIISSTMLLWPLLLILAYKLKETHTVALTSLPPMLASIIISMGSGAILSLVVDRFKLIALYQPVVNGFGANLIAVQASRVSTWLWCSALRRISVSSESLESTKKALGSLASFTAPIVYPSEGERPGKLGPVKLLTNFIKTILWSFFNSSPNSTAARLLLLVILPAHTIYFFVIWLLSPAGLVHVTGQFYLMYIGLCLLQVCILLTMCEPFMTLLMRRNLDPDIFGISILMALADLLGTLCITSAFFILAKLGDPNAT